jgi:hypothetical protein
MYRKTEINRRSKKIPKKENGDGHKRREKRHKGKIFFVESIEHVIVGPETLDNPGIGVRWLRGMLPEREFQKKVVEGEGDETIRLKKFRDTKKEKVRGVDQDYYDSTEPLNHFLSPDDIREEAARLISGENLRPAPMDRKPRRRKPLDEKKKILKRIRGRKNKKCIFCKIKADKTESEVLMTRCNCPKEKGATPSAIRIHTACMKKQMMENGLSQLECDVCKKKRFLPVNQS